MHRVEVLYTPETGLWFSIYVPWEKINLRLLTPFVDELCHKPDVITRLKARGCKTIREQLREYLICFYGGNDNVADLDGGRTTSDYCHCGCRGGFCPDEGYRGLCSRPIINGASLNPAELANLQLAASDKSVKEVAEIRKRSPFTIEAQERSIREKLNVHGIAGAVAKGILTGIIKPDSISGQVV